MIHPTREEALSREVLADEIQHMATECEFATTRDGELEPCDKPTVAVVIYPWEGGWVIDAACLHHAHQSGKARVVPLGDVIAAAREARA